MNRIQFIILTVLASIVALCILLQIVLGQYLSSDSNNLRQAENALRSGETSVGTWKQIVQVTGQVAESKNDQALKDVLTRQGLTIRAQPNGGAAAPNNPAPAPAGATH